MEDTQYVGHRITFLRTFKLVCALFLAAICVVLLTPRNTAALDLSAVLGQVAKVQDSLIPKSSSGHTQSQSAKKQTQSSSTVNSEPSAAPAQTVAATPPPVPAAPPAPEALPPEIESIANIPSRQQLLALISGPLLSPESLAHHSIVTYPDTDSFAVVKPSTEGWKILGISWMWWAAGSTVVWLGARLQKVRG